MKLRKVCDGRRKVKRGSEKEERKAKRMVKI